MANDQSAGQNIQEVIAMYKNAIENLDLGGSGQDMRRALNKGLPQGIKINTVGGIGREAKSLANDARQRYVQLAQ